MFPIGKSNSSPSDIKAKEKLALYVHEYLVQVGAQKAAALFLSEICCDAQMPLGETPGSLMQWWSVFYDLYATAPERRDPTEHSSDYGPMNSCFPNGMPPHAPGPAMNPMHPGMALDRRPYLPVGPLGPRLPPGARFHPMSMPHMGGPMPRMVLTPSPHGMMPPHPGGGYMIPPNSNVGMSPHGGGGAGGMPPDPRMLMSNGGMPPNYMNGVPNGGIMTSMAMHVGPGGMMMPSESVANMESMMGAPPAVSSGGGPRMEPHMPPASICNAPIDNSEGPSIHADGPPSSLVPSSEGMMAMGGPPMPMPPTSHTMLMNGNYPPPIGVGMMPMGNLGPHPSQMMQMQMPPDMQNMPPPDNGYPPPNENPYIRGGVPDSNMLLSGGNGGPSVGGTNSPMSSRAPSHPSNTLSGHPQPLPMQRNNLPSLNMDRDSMAIMKLKQEMQEDLKTYDKNFDPEKYYSVAPPH